jgi:hypothetical protein
VGTESWEVVCDDNGISGDSEYCGNNNAQLSHIGVF